MSQRFTIARAIGLELSDDVAHHRFSARRRLRFRVFKHLHFGDQEGFSLQVAQHAHPFQALRKDESALIGHAHDLVHRGQRSHRMQIVRLGRVEPRVQLSHDHD